MLPSLKVPVACNCSVSVSVTDDFTGVTAIETTTGGTTVTVSVPLIEPNAAVIVPLPTACAVTRPVLFTVATVEAEPLHVTWLVRS